MTFSVRGASVEDLDRLVLLFDAYRQFYGQPSDLTIARQFLHDRLARGESVVLLAEDHDKTAIGFAQLFLTFSSILAAPIAILHDLFVVPAARRRGVGTLLLNAAAETARAAGAVRLELATAITNDPARKLYEKLGWKRDDEFYGYGFPLVGERA
ncbi:MAG TPA: GNAT family N-acetyltransferase [Nitrospira sp.]|nr:GNAT family N-acetyltransferase [Nitrospira sp.]